MGKTKVVRGAGGRFERVPAVDGEGVQDENCVDVDSKGPKGAGNISLISLIVENSERVRATSLELSNAFHYTGLIDDNSLYSRLAYSEQDRIEDGEREDAEEYSAAHMIGSIAEVEREVNEETLLSTAGNVLGFRVVPALSLALFVFNNMTGNDRSLAFDHLLNLRITNNVQRYENTIELHNRIISELDNVNTILFGFDGQQEPGPQTYVTQGDLPLIKMLRDVNDLLTAVGDICRDLETRINSELA